MLEDTTGEGAIRIEEANRRKRARPDDEGGRPDVEMVEAARTPVQYGGSSPASGGETRGSLGAKTLRESNLAETWSEQSCGILRALCVQQRRHSYSRVKSSRPLWTQSASMPRSWVRHTWPKRTSGRSSCQGVRRSWGAPSVSSQVRLWTCGMVGTWPRRPVDRSAGGRCIQSVQSW